MLTEKSGITTKKKIAPGLKTIFLLHFIIAGAVGLQHLLVPRVWTDLAGIEIIDTITWRLIGAALISFAVSSWMAYRERVWERVRIIVAMEIVWSALGAFVILWGLVFEALPALEWLNVVLLVGFATAFAVFYSKLNRA